MIQKGRLDDMLQFGCVLGIKKDFIQNWTYKLNLESIVMSQERLADYLARVRCNTLEMVIEIGCK